MSKRSTRASRRCTAGGRFSFCSVRASSVSRRTARNRPNRVLSGEARRGRAGEIRGSPLIASNPKGTNAQAHHPRRLCRGTRSSIGASSASAAPSPSCATIKSGTITTTTGKTITTGTDQYGYNYQAHSFNGTYDGSDRVLDGMYCGHPDVGRLRRRRYRHEVERQLACQRRLRPRRQARPWTR